MKPLNFLSIFFIVLLVQSCATVRSTNTYTVYVDTEPTGASIVVSDRKNQVIYTTQSPDSITLNSGMSYFKRSAFTFEANKTGYLPATRKLEFEVDGKYYLNFFTSFFMPVAFLIIDPISGAMWQPKEQEIFINLEPRK